MRNTLTILHLFFSGLLLAVPLNAQTTSETPTLGMFTKNDAPVFACVEIDCEMLGTIPPYTRVEVTDLLPGRAVAGQRLWYEILWPLQPGLADFSSKLLVHAPLTTAQSLQDIRLIRAMAWSPDGTRIATLDSQGKLSIWDVSSRQSSEMTEESIPGDLDYVNFASIAWSPDNTRIALVGTGYTTSAPFFGSVLDIRDAISGEHLIRLSQQGRDKALVAVTWTANRAIHVLADSDRETLLIRDAMSGSELSSLDLPAFFFTDGWYEDLGNTMIWSPDGTGLVTLVPLWGDIDESIMEGSKNVLIWNTGDGSHVTLKGHNYPIIDAAWSPDGSRIASTSRVITLVHDRGSGEVLAVFLDYLRDSSTCSVDWSPDGSRIATGTCDGMLLIWNATDYELLDSSRVLSYAISDLSWSPDGARIAIVGNYHGTSLRIIDLPPPVEARRAFIHSSQLGSA